ncbi:MAG TPA: hypothetical protein VFZ69_05475 [Longimicrobiales bacterium]
MRRIWLPVALLALACADEIPEDVSAQMEAARTAGQPDTTAPDIADLLGTAPAGGQADWIADLRSGLDTVPALAALDRGEALHEVQELYSRRFEPLRQFYGVGGAIDAGAAVAQAIEEAGTQLQQLMRHLASNTADSAAIDAAVTASREALTRIDAAARAAGLAPNAPRDMPAPIS